MREETASIPKLAQIVLRGATLVKNGKVVKELEADKAYLAMQLRDIEKNGVNSIYVVSKG